MKSANLIHFLRENHAHFWRATLFVVALGLIVLFFPRKTSAVFDFEIGEPWKYETIRAQVGFDVPKSKDLFQNEIQEAIESSPLVFHFQKQQSVEMAEGLNRSLSQIPPNLQSEQGVLLLAAEFLLNESENGILQASEEWSRHKPKKPVLVVISEQQSFYAALSDFQDVQSVRQEMAMVLKAVYPDNNIGEVLEWITPHITSNLLFDDIGTQEQIEMAISKVDSVQESIAAGTILIENGQLLSEEQARRIAAYQASYSTSFGKISSIVWMLIGQLLSVSIALLLLYFFLRILRPQVLEDYAQLSFILLNVVIMSWLASWLIHKHTAYFYLAPFCMLPLVIRAFYDSRLALFVHLVSIIIIGIQEPDPFEFSFLQLSAGIITVLMVQNLYRRGALASSALKIIGMYVLAYAALSLVTKGSPMEIDYMHFALFAGSGVLSLFANPLIYFYEKTFNLVSDVTLLEYSDTNNPLLRQLSERAPGTFQHSMQVANLSESVIHEIGGNVLLMRVGALYHDIGKLNHPVYFIENQVGGINPHDELPFEESAAIIINHVKEGITLAKKNGLPDRIIDFIRTHHGTTMVQYFYKQYLKNFPDEIVDKSKFSYPGPLPYTKEMAVLMIADAVEAASRSLVTKDALTIEKLVDSIIDRLLNEGQFNQAQITLKEISVARAMMKRKLLSIYHLRIEYPE